MAVQVVSSEGDLEAVEKVTHATTIVERNYAASPLRVFTEWGSPDAHRKWHTPGDGWLVAASERDFVLGGRDYCRFGPPGEPIHHSDGLFLLIAPGERVISAGTMYCREIPTSSTLCTVEFLPMQGGGTRLVLTDQSAYFDGLHDPTSRHLGWQTILENLAVALGMDERAE